ncbi:MAG TPA: metal ABC transporter ATP-binding protein [Micromonosporaceae bacterium]|nr:metal ABC transporter ATP-binding protein [Micromonosporaceae bacterium]
MVSYGADPPALRRAQLKVVAGETVAVLGANGSGKSTLIRVALGLVPLVSGSVTLFGTPLRRFRDWKKIGYVPQRIGAASGVPATVREVVAAGRLVRQGLFRPASEVDRDAVDAAIAAVGLTELARDPVATLSGGQQQRTLIARALAGEPEMLVLDEPTVGVDVASQQNFTDTLRRFVRGGGTVVVVTHELGPLESLVNRAVVLHHGEVVHDSAVPVAGQATPTSDQVHPHARRDQGWLPPHGEVVRSRQA